MWIEAGEKRLGVDTSNTGDRKMKTVRRMTKTLTVLDPDWRPAEWLPD